MSDPTKGAGPVAPELAARFTVRSRMEIGRILQAIMQQHEPVTAHYGSAGESLLSAIVAVDGDSGEFFLDLSPDAQANRRLLEAGRAVLVSFHDRVKVQFAAERVEQAVHAGRPALRVQLPAALLKLQRREAYRVQPPLSAPVTCVCFGVRGRFEMRVLDISIGGMRLGGAAPDGEMAAGMRYQRCMLSLPEVGNIETAINVHYVVEARLRDGRGSTAVGCSFERLAPGMETLLQRYVIKVDRERRARLSDR